MTDPLQIPQISSIQEGGQLFEAKKRMIARTRLVKIGSIPLTELSKLKSYALNTRSDGQFANTSHFDMCIAVMYVFTGVYIVCICACGIIFGIPHDRLCLWLHSLLAPTI